MPDPLSGAVGAPRFLEALRPQPLSPTAPAAGAAPSFHDVLMQSVQQVESLDLQAQNAIAQGLSGGDLTQAEVLTSFRKADMALRTMMQIRNKVLDAYQEVQQMRM